MGLGLTGKILTGSQKGTDMTTKTSFENRTDEITYEELKELESFKDYTEEQAKQLIQTMKTFARIIYDISAQELNSNSKLIELNTTENSSKAA